MINVYPAAATDFSTLGVTTLSPASCTIEERAGGLFELEMTHPIDADLKWTYLQTGNIIKAPCAIREAPILRVNDNIASGSSTKTRAIYKVTTDGRRLRLRAQPSESAKILHAYKPGTEVVRMSVSGNWANVVVCSNGQSGYMWAANLTFVRNETETVTADEEKPSAVVETQQTREQLFRIYSVAPDSASGMVTVKASHVFYDLKGIVCTKEYAPENVAANEVLTTILANLSATHGFTFHCTVTAAISGDYSGVSVVRVLLDPEIGIVPLTHAQIIRDNFDVYILPDTPMDRGMEIRHRKNLIGAVLTTDASNVVTRIRPVGKDKDGNRLFITDNGGWVESANKALYPTSLDAEIEYDVTVSKDKDSKFKTDAEARAELKRLAEADFANGADAATVGLEVGFAALENTEEYKAYAKMQRLFLYDQVRVVAAYAGINAKLRVNGYVFDCLLKRYDDVYVGDISALEQVTYGYEIASGTVSGTKLLPNSVNANTVMRRATIGYAKISQAAVEQLSADSLVAVKAEIQRLVAGQITTDQLYVDLAAIAVAQITTANIDKANIDWATIKNLTAAITNIANASIGTAKIDWAKIYDLTADTAIITEGVGGKLYIARLAVTEANMTSLTVGELMVKAEDGSFKRITVDADGSVKAKTVQVEGGNVADNTISGGKLIENTITARELNVESIFADTALIRAIKAANIDVSDMFAAEATISELNGWLIKAETITALQGQLNLWASEKINLAVGALAIGGTNLVLSTDTINGDKTVAFGAPAAGSTVLHSTYDGAEYAAQNALQVTFTAGGSGANIYWFPSYSPVLVNGRTYTWQIKAYISDKAAGLDVDMGLEAGGLAAKHLTWQWATYSHTFVYDSSSTYKAFHINGAFAAGDKLFIADFKIEEGDKATGWTRHPDEQNRVQIGSSILMDDEHIRMDTKYYEVNVSGENGDFHADENGLSAKVGNFETLICPEVVKRVAGRNITITTPSGLQAELDRLNGGMLDGSETITLACDQYGDVTLHGMYGNNTALDITGGYAINGKITIVDCHAQKINFDGVTINSTAKEAISIYDSAWVRIGSCTINTASSYDGVQIYGGTIAMMYNCGIYNAANALNIDWGGRLDFLNLKGTAATYLWAKGCVVTGNGSRPSGNYVGQNVISNWSDMTTIAVDTGSGVTPPAAVTTTSYTASTTGTYYPSGHWISGDNYIRQGFEGKTSTRSDYGCMWFDASALAGKTIKSATLTLKRRSGYGRSGSVTITLWTTTHTGKSGVMASSTLTSLGEIGTIANGETATFNIPTSAIAAIAAGGGLVTYTGETTKIENKDYSRNYAHFEGTDGAAPVLTVTYQ